jgi:hypothetical protein
MVRRVIAVAAAVVLTALVPGAVAAETPLAPGGPILLNGSHGYKLLAQFGAKEGKGVMQLVVGRRGEAAIYEAVGEVTAERIDIDLGALGRFDLERQPTGKTETARPCGKPKQVPGYEFVGTIEFHGEEGFTEVVAARAKLDWKTVFSLVCGKPSFGGEDFGAGIPGVRIRARQKRGPRLQLNQDHLGGKVTYRAELDEREGAVRVSRLLGGRIGGGALQFTSSLSSATFSGAGPFSGAATYLEARPPRGPHPGQGVWRGDLEVDFPGAARVRLAGPGFRAGIIHAHRTESR